MDSKILWEKIKLCWQSITEQVRFQDHGDYLMSRDALSFDDFDRIRTMHGKEQTQEMLLTMRRKSPESVFDFMDSLRRECGHVAREIEDKVVVITETPDSSAMSMDSTILWEKIKLCWGSIAEQVRFRDHGDYLMTKNAFSFDDFDRIRTMHGKDQTHEMLLTMRRKSPESVFDFMASLRRECIHVAREIEDKVVVITETPDSSAMSMDSKMWWQKVQLSWQSITEQVRFRDHGDYLLTKNAFSFDDFDRINTMNGKDQTHEMLLTMRRKSPESVFDFMDSLRRECGHVVREIEDKVVVISETPDSSAMSMDSKLLWQKIKLCWDSITEQVRFRDHCDYLMSKNALRFDDFDRIRTMNGKDQTHEMLLTMRRKAPESVFYFLDSLRRECPHVAMEIEDKVVVIADTTDSSTHAEMPPEKLLHAENQRLVEELARREETLRIMKEGNTFAELNVGELLGAGGCARVYSCIEDPKVVIKKVEIVPNQTKRGKMQVEEMYNEVKQLQWLEHPRVVRYVGSYTTDTDFCMVLDKITGGSLHQRLQEHGAFDEDLCRKYTIQILDGLTYLHKKKIIHRDLKGANVLLDEFGNIKLCDFGLAKLMEYSTRYIAGGSTNIAGTVHWMAPEVVKGERYGRNSDIWSLGCTLVEMLTVKPPWPDLELVQVMFQICQGSQPMYTLPEGLSEAALDFIELCFTINPNERPSAAKLMQHRFVEGTVLVNSD